MANSKQLRVLKSLIKEAVKEAFKESLQEAPVTRMEEKPQIKENTFTKNKTLNELLNQTLEGMVGQKPTKYTPEVDAPGLLSSNKSKSLDEGKQTINIQVDQESGVVTFNPETSYGVDMNFDFIKKSKAVFDKTLEKSGK